MSFSLSCGDVMPGCEARFVGDTEDDVLGQVASHAQADHGLAPSDLTPELVGQVRARITQS